MESTERTARDGGQRTALAACNLCEAICGLELTIEDRPEGPKVVSIRGNADDPLSRGHICPKGVALADVYDDPDRLRRPVKRVSKGSGAGADDWVEISWDEALDLTADGLARAVNEHGRDALGIYFGNPNVHSLGSQTHGVGMMKTFRTRNKFSATSVDQLPHQFVAAELFGPQLMIPIADLDRTSYFLVFGANPMASNGSLMTVPDFPNRLREMKKRGGRMVVFDPRRTETAKVADEHHFVRPGTDAAVLLSMVHVLFEEGLTDPPPYVSGTESVRLAVAEFTPEYAAQASGVPADEIRRITREFAAADAAAAYGRIGLSTQGFGTICQWAIQCLNILTGNFDREGGVMFTEPAIDIVGKAIIGRGHHDVWRSRVRQAPEFAGELPVSTMREEIETPGEGQIRALVTAGGNPCVSTPNAARLTAAIESLDFMVSLDLYVHETSRLADVVLPAPSPLQQPHYDIAFNNLSVRNNARWADAALPVEDGQQHEWQTLLRLAAAVVDGVDAQAVEQLTVTRAVELSVADEGSRIHGRDRDEILHALGDTPGPERLVDLALRSGAYGDGFGANPGGITLQTLRDNPDGVDLGPLQPRIPETLRTPSGTIELAPQPLLDDANRLRQRLAETGEAPPMVLIGRRDLRSNNSWMHNIEMLVRGKPRCTLYVNPQDAARLLLADAGMARVRSRVGEVVVPVEVTDEIMPGVVSLPHGWGHGQPGSRQAVAAEYAGVNSNLLSDETLIDPLSGNAVLSGIPVTVEVAEAALV